MNRGFYTSVSAMMVGTKKLNDVANNMVNSTTTGYKKDVSTVNQFADLVIDKMDEGKYVGNLDNQVFVQETYTIFSQGSIYATNIDTNFALNGEGFFKVEKNGEYLYTRDGGFQFDNNGYLVTSDGGYVMGLGNQRINKEDTNNIS